MWLGKFLDLEEDMEELRSKIKQEIFKDITKSKLTPLEFTIIEVIFNTQALSGYDLMLSLNRHFAGTWEAKSGTIYPILSKLEKNGFLKSKMVKSPIGPLRKVYTLTKAGEELLKLKVNKNAKRVDTLNYPQTGKIKMLSLGNTLTFYIISRHELVAAIPRYIRLGKFMSKGKVTVKKRRAETGEERTEQIDAVLNPVDLPETLQLRRFDICNIHPTTFLKHVEATGTFYELPGGIYLPTCMRFGVDQL